MYDIYLIKTLDLTDYSIKIYSTEPGLNIDQFIEFILSDILIAPYPRQISDMILSVNGVNLIEIFDKENNIILVTSNILPENLSYHEE